MINDITEKLKAMLSPKRYMHSLGVRDTAVKLAKLYGTDEDKAAIAGLIHDCAKGLSDELLLKIAREIGIETQGIYEKQPELLHGPAGTYMAKKDFKIEDEEILHSIMCHTTGCENMSLLDKIIYIADYIEPNRSFPGLEELRKAAFRDIDEAMLLALDNTIKHVINKKQMIDIQTIKARNYILYNYFK
ncbi:putative nicotinate-nucleotide adenylyltransferase [Oxobacter pfennigii]|uniref:bis(5'-nucleosyl)-tetraphosphatase (symmetrical) n=1 Tax=Oxobacter pfennigii TaxID=36849 RepID=A0A0N8NT89_9CLOT|nr:bis(5'-nucleosyl)-tetraphosphatase (symmetrical) YqeK [Oxobacter pfennigii]KPU44160.1 putative nicotinate-nucleotide adenylyltransferase [Oxobacter pfennigii]